MPHIKDGTDEPLGAHPLNVALLSLGVCDILRVPVRTIVYTYYHTWMSGLINTVQQDLPVYDQYYDYTL